MKKNIGKTDKIIRFSIAILLVVLYYLGYINGNIGVASLLVAAALILTSLFSFCGLYTLLGITTCPLKK